MSTQTVGDPDDLNDVAIVNIRAEIARRRHSIRSAALAMGVTQQRMSDKMNGRTRLTLGDLDLIARWLGIEPGELLVRHQGLEPRTRWFGVWARLTALLAGGQRAAIAPVVDLSVWRAGRAA